MDQKEFQKKLTDAFRILLIAVSDVVEYRDNLTSGALPIMIKCALEECDKIAKLLCIDDLKVNKEKVEEMAKTMPLDEIFAKMVKAGMNGYVLLAEDYIIGEQMSIDYLRRAHGWLTTLQTYVSIHKV